MKKANQEIEFKNAQESISEKLGKTLEAGEKISKVMDGLEVMPNERNLLVIPYAKNPYNKMEQSSLGIYTGDTGGMFKNPDSGEEDRMEQGIVVARVIEVGPDCKSVAAGDDIYYTSPSQTTLPFFSQGFYIVHESRVLAIINVGLSDRLKK